MQRIFKNTHSVILSMICLCRFLFPNLRWNGVSETLLAHVETSWRHTCCTHAVLSIHRFQLVKSLGQDRLWSSLSFKMDGQDGCNNTPDSWDQNDDGGAGDQDQNVSQATSAFAGLNVNAAPFVPGQNVYAKEFVPSFLSKPSTEGKLVGWVTIFLSIRFSHTHMRSFFW